ncbi:MAG: flippase-like domain-containing protein [Actinobacteria bacterium]|nr:flippase-like domain-containing protein [Actinomycetota bacterium]
MDRIIDAIQEFWGYLSAIELVPLALAIACHLVKTLCTGRAWRNVLAAAYPGVKVPFRSIYGAYVAGVGINSILPARSGDVVRVWFAHRAIPGASYPTVIASSLVLSIVDSSLALVLFLWALTQGVLPSLDVLPSLPSFDFRWFFDPPAVGQGAIVAIAILVVVLVILVRERVGHLREHLAQSLNVFRPRSRYLRTVVFWQLCDWALRFVAIWFFLGAFGIEQSVRNVLLVQVTQSIATLIPISPGGVGTEQALIAFVFKGVAPASVVVPFSVGMKITLTVVNVVLAFAAIALTLRTFRVRGAIRKARNATRPPTAPVDD